MSGLSSDSPTAVTLEKIRAEMSVRGQAFRAEQQALNELKRKMYRCEVSLFASWVIKNFPQVHYLDLDPSYREISAEDLMDKNGNSIDDPDDEILDAINDMLEENYRSYQFTDIAFGSFDYDKFDLHEVSSWNIEA
jgi:hypothetical protein